MTSSRAHAPSTSPGPAAVHLITGAVLDGVLGTFAPDEPAVSLTVGGASRQEPTENIAWIAFPRASGTPGAPGAPGAPGTPGAPASVAGAEPFHVHVAGGHVLHVRAVPAETDSDVGFFAAPLDDTDPNGHLYIFAHATNAIERDVSLGALLVAAGALGAHTTPRAAPTEARRAPIGQVLLDLKKADRAAVDEAVLVQRRKKLRLGDVLVEAGIASQVDIDAALAEQKRRPAMRLGELLVERGTLTDLALARALAAKFQLPLIDLDDVELNPAARSAVPREIMGKYGVLPADIDGSVLTVAIADPLVTDAIDMLRFQSRLRIRLVLVTEGQLRRALADASRDPTPASAPVSAPVAAPVSAPVSGRGLGARTGTGPPARAPTIEMPTDAARDPEGIMRLVNQLIEAAAQRGASDVHIEPSGDDRPIAVRYRIDGRCVAATELPGKLRSALGVRLKVMANLDIAERRRPQDGKLRIVGGDGKNIDIRITTIPTVDDNEDIVMRLLLGSRAIAFDDLLLSPQNAAAVRAWMQLDHGLLLCVGPTGVGKTTTVHGMLSTLDTTELKVWTAEDPVEIISPGLRQVHVQPRIDFTFANALRTFLRADPDVIMIGEMRDLDTAALAVEASLTGHLVLSTLHTKSAPDTIARMLDMGLEPFTVADALSGVLSQRLVRKLCDRCKASDLASADDVATLTELVGAAALARARDGATGPPRMWRAVGCDACAHTGYRGRIALHEVLTVTDALRPLIGRRAPVDEIRRVAGDAMIPMREDGLVKALAGLTDMREVLAVT